MDTERLLLESVRKLEKDAIGKIFDLYASPLYNYALRLCGDPLLADHVVGDVFARLLEQCAMGKGPTSNLRSYLYETAYHRIVDEARSSGRRAPLEALTSSRHDAGSGVSGFEDQILFKMVLKAIRYELTDDQRHVILLRFLEEFSLRETAAILGKDVQNVKVIQSRALARLRKVLEPSQLRKAVSLPGVRELSKALRV